MQLKKNILRKKYRAIRNNISEREDKNKKIISKFIALELLQKHDLIALYNPIDGEVNPLPIREMIPEKKFCLPFISSNNEMRFREWGNNSVLKSDSSFNFKYPVDGAEVIPTLIVVPLIAFDLSCNRLGFGKGFFDSLIARYKTLNTHPFYIGLAYETQLCSTIPVESHDQQLDLIITENNLYLKS